MFDKEKHKRILIKILKEIYSNPVLRNRLLFKGGTAAFLLYGLPRLSVDLDFDLLDENKKNEVFAELKKILSNFGHLIDATEKRYTLFFLLSYEKNKRKIKVEISKRSIKTKSELRNYLGIPILVMAKEQMLSSKLAAFLTRKKLAVRDLFDLWFFLKNDWSFDEDFFYQKTCLSLKQGIKNALTKLKKVKKNQLLSGLGDLLDKKQKNWVKDKLKEELAFYLNLYLEN